MSSKVATACNKYVIIEKMKTILYMATTINGLIAKHDDTAEFLTEAEAASYVAAVKGAGAAVVGRRTYEVLSEQPEFEEFTNAGVRMVVLSQKDDIKLKSETHAIAHSPKEALEVLKDCNEVVVAGGGKVNAAFMEAGLIDEIYLDIEPAVLGKGIPFFDGEDFEASLQLLDQKMLSPHEIQLHYRVVKD